MPEVAPMGSIYHLNSKKAEIALLSDDRVEGSIVQIRPPGGVILPNAHLKRLLDVLQRNIEHSPLSVPKTEVVVSLHLDLRTGRFSLLDHDFAVFEDLEGVLDVFSVQELG